MPRRPDRPLPRAANCAAASALDHLDWAAGIAGKVARDFHLRGQERDDVVGAAHLILCDLASRRPGNPEGLAAFDPDCVPPGGDAAAAFRGWAYDWVRCECVREAERIRGGGTFNTKRRGAGAVVARPLGDSAESVAGGADEFAVRPDSPEPELLAPPDPRPVYGRRLALGGG